MSDLDLLRSLGEQITPPAFDALRETARRRTRRTATVTTALAAAAVVAVVGTLQLELADHDSAPPPPTSPPKVDARPLTYAEGDTVHYGGQSVSMPGRVVEIDLTDDGVAVRTADDRIWFTDGASVEEIRAIGESGGGDDESHGGDYLWGTYVGRMVTGTTGSKVAWLEFSQHGLGDVWVYDTESGELSQPAAIDLPYTDVASGLYSVDDEAVYGFTDLTYGEELRPTWRIEYATAAFKTIDQPQRYAEILRSHGLARTLLISDRKDVPADFVPFDGVMEFSVIGARITARGKEPHFVRDGLTGQDFEFSAPTGYPDTDSLWLVQWLDDDTVVLHAKQQGGVDLLECDVATSECAVALRVSSDAVVPEIG